MAFNISGGLSSAATSLGDTAKEANIAADKWDLEKQKIALVDQLQTKHEEAGRTFQTSERVATQEFTGGENTKNRQNSVDIANITSKATVQAAGVTAGGAVRAAQIHADIMQKQIDQNAPLIAAQIKQVGASTDEQQAKTAFQIINNNNATEKERAQKEYSDAVASGDPDRITKAGTAVAVANFNMGEAQTRATVDANLAKIAKDEVDKIRAQMALPINQAPENAARIQPTLKAAEDKFNQLMTQAERSARAAPMLPEGTGTAGIIKYDAAGNRVGAAAPAAPSVTGTPAPTSMPMPSPGATGLINGGPM